MQRWALVTGASSGIGLELARLLARGGYDIIAVARDETALRQLSSELKRRYSTDVRVLAIDLAHQSAGDQVWEYTEKHHIELEILVNNAGFADYSEFTNSDWGKLAKMINLNILALTYLTRLYAPGMATRRRGRIINVASTAAFVPGPLMAVYHASKWYVRSLSLSLREELHGTGVSITTLYPGPTATNFQKTAEQENVAIFAQRERLGKAYEVAQSGYEAMMDGRASAMPGLGAKLTFVLGWFFPDRLVGRYIYRLYSRQQNPNR